MIQISFYAKSESLAIFRALRYQGFNPVADTKALIFWRALRALRNKGFNLFY